MHGSRPGRHHRPGRSGRKAVDADGKDLTETRPLLVDDPARAKALWPVLGRPGAVLHDGEIIGTWRPRKAGTKLTVAVDLWARSSVGICDAIEEQAERLAAYRQTRLAAVDFTT